MSNQRTDDSEYVDQVALATRVIAVDSAGTPIPPGGGGLTDAQLRAVPVPVSGTVTANPPATVQRVTAITRVITATTTAITAGKKSYTVTVIAAASAASPTLDGVALPAGYTASYSSPSNDTLESASVVTVLGDDVIILAVT